MYELRTKVKLKTLQEGYFSFKSCPQVAGQINSELEVRI